MLHPFMRKLNYLLCKLNKKYDFEMFVRCKMADINFIHFINMGQKWWSLRTFRNPYSKRETRWLQQNKLSLRNVHPIFQTSEIIAQIWLDPLRDFCGHCHWITFFKKLFSLKSWFFATSSLHNLGDQKQCKELWTKSVKCNFL